MINRFRTFSARLGSSALLLAGCTSPSQMLVDHTNRTVMCSATGWGFIGAPVAHHEYSKCVDFYEGQGYLDVEDAGVVGINISTNSLSVISLTPGGPAAAIGIAVGDKLVQVNGEPVSDGQTALKLMFGKAETPLTLTMQRNGQTIPFTLIRAHRPQPAMKK